MNEADELLAAPPDIRRVNVLAAKPGLTGPLSGARDFGGVVPVAVLTAHRNRFIGGVSIGAGETKYFTPAGPIALYFTDSISVRERDLAVDDNIALEVVDIDQSCIEFSSLPEWTSASYTFTIQLDGPTELRPDARR